MNILSINLDKIVVDEKRISKYSDEIEIIINEEIVYRGKISDYNPLNVNDYVEPVVIELFVKIDGYYLYVDKLVGRHSEMVFDRERVVRYINSFYNNLTGAVYD